MNSYFLDHSLKIQPMMTAKSWCLEHKLLGARDNCQTVCVVKKQRARNACAKLGF